MVKINILEGHYYWCLKNGRDTSWYKPEEKNQKPQILKKPGVSSKKSSFKSP